MGPLVPPRPLFSGAAVAATTGACHCDAAGFRFPAARAERAILYDSRWKWHRDRCRGRGATARRAATARTAGPHVPPCSQIGVARVHARVHAPTTHRDGARPAGTRVGQAGWVPVGTHATSVWERRHRHLAYHTQRAVRVRKAAAGRKATELWPWSFLFFFIGAPGVFAGIPRPGRITPLESLAAAAVAATAVTRSAR